MIHRSPGPLFCSAETRQTARGLDFPRPPLDTQIELLSVETLSLANVCACLDTNVVLKISTLVDLNRASVTSLLLMPSLLERQREEVRSCLAAAWLCQERALTTFSLRHEVGDKLDQLAPSGTVEASTPWFFAWFLKDYVLPRWTSLIAEAQEPTDQNLSGNERDRYLVSRAQEFECPVITLEVKPKGAVAKAAKKLQVSVLTPEQWLLSCEERLPRLANGMMESIRQQMLRFMCDRAIRSSKALQNCVDYVTTMEFILDASIPFQPPDPLLGWVFQIDS